MKIFKKSFYKKVEPYKALAIAKKIEMGTLNQLKMNASKSELNSTVNQVQRMGIANASLFSNMNTTARPEKAYNLPFLLNELDFRTS